MSYNSNKKALTLKKGSVSTINVTLAAGTNRQAVNKLISATNTQSLTVRNDTKYVFRIWIACSAFT